MVDELSFLVAVSIWYLSGVLIFCVSHRDCEWYPDNFLAVGSGLFGPLWLVWFGIERAWRGR